MEAVTTTLTAAADETRLEMHLYDVRNTSCEFPLLGLICAFDVASALGPENCEEKADTVSSSTPARDVTVPFTADGERFELRLTNKRQISVSALEHRELHVFSGLVFQSVASNTKCAEIASFLSPCRTSSPSSSSLSQLLLVPLSAADPLQVDWPLVRAAVSCVGDDGTSSQLLSDVLAREGPESFRRLVASRVVFSNSTVRQKVRVADVREGVVLDRLFAKVMKASKTTETQEGDEANPVARPPPSPGDDVCEEKGTSKECKPFEEQTITPMLSFAVACSDVIVLYQKAPVSRSIRHPSLSSLDEDSDVVGDSSAPTYPRFSRFATPTPREPQNPPPPALAPRQEAFFEDGPSSELTVVTPRPSDLTSPFVLDLTLTAAFLHPISLSLASCAYPVPLLLSLIDDHSLARRCAAALLPSTRGTPPLLLEALTSPSALRSVNYERLETLGDCVLKLLATLHVCCKFPKMREGFLCERKIEIITNGHLCEVFDLIGLEKFVIVKPTVARLVLPDGLRPNLPKKKEEEEDKGGRRGTFARSGGKKLLPEKVRADVVEAVIGAMYVDAGLKGAWDALVQLRVIVEDKKGGEGGVDCEEKEENEPMTSLQYPDVSKMLPSLPTLGVDTYRPALPSTTLPDLSTLLGYSFSNPALAIEALTHPSCCCGLTTITSCSYQRLEFLGDAVLDLVVTRRLYEAKPASLNPHEISEWRSRVICNDMLARIARSQGMYRLMRLGPVAAGLGRIFEQFDTKLEDELGDKVKDKGSGPKALSDLLEAVIGAVFVDSGGSWEVIEDVCERVLFEPFWTEWGRMKAMEAEKEAAAKATASEDTMVSGVGDVEKLPTPDNRPLPRRASSSFSQSFGRAKNAVLNCMGLEDLNTWTTWTRLRMSCGNFVHILRGAV